MQIGHPGTSPDYHDKDQGGATVRNTGHTRSLLLTGEEDAPNNYRATFEAGIDGESSSPRHHHNFEQIRYVLEGDYSIGTDQILPAGHIGYFPESSYYGPQLRKPNVRMLTLQFGGPSGNGLLSVQQRRKGLEALLERGGTLEGGMYVTVDEDGNRHNQDAFEALWEHLSGEKIVYPRSRYDSIILIDPGGFGWVDDEHEGVTRKPLGTFSERDTRLGFVRLEKGASIPLGTEPSPEILFLKQGSISHNGEVHAPLTAFATATHDGPEPLTAEEDSELLYIKLPTF